MLASGTVLPCMHQNATFGFKCNLVRNLTQQGSGRTELLCTLLSEPTFFLVRWRFTFSLQESRLRFHEQHYSGYACCGECNCSRRIRLFTVEPNSFTVRALQFNNLRAIWL